MKGVPLRTVQELMGHKSLAMTLRYAHLSPGHTLAAICLLDAEQTGTATGTDQEATARVAAQGTEVVEFLFLRKRIGRQGFEPRTR
jgi:hypothetical protein